LPVAPAMTWEAMTVRVTSASGFMCHHVFYTVPSRLVGHRLQPLRRARPALRSRGQRARDVLPRGRSHRRVARLALHGGETDSGWVYPSREPQSGWRLVWALRHSLQGLVRDDRPFYGKDPPAAAYFYSPDRSGEHPATHLATFTGFPRRTVMAASRQIPLPKRSPAAAFTG